MPEIRYRTVAVIAASVLGPIVLWVLLDLLIVTDEEQIEQRLDEMAVAVERGDADAAVAAVAEDYRHMGLTRADLRAAAVAYFEAYGETRVRVADARINVTGHRAAAHVMAPWRAERGETQGLRIPTSWEFTFEKRASGWVAVEITPVRFGQFELGEWGAILRRLGVVPGAQHEPP